ncbi:MAG: Aspartate-semialdehyde dehydrogenase [Candidatus Nomurabacteria bacterium GW2011_GWA2_40_9]|uniref:aspartate-semialdehyde dehydrogenase n=1 Tax=Candidatus Nomurabacteria bacterium GW2011_GWA2_40_9 TaxID=1618734 RepID=A0A0G0TQ02_9BACT|nr:MAG: Aspartate-semialdehyde dehydrogenase [Candidatus Nomurabacteria bacterium GW2011_GWA2_40_9]
MKKFKVGVLGATGMVGQNYIRLLENHPWFDVVYLAASANSAGMKYSDAVAGRWVMSTLIPENIKDITVEDVANIEKAKNCDFVFSAFEMPDKKLIKETEEKYASMGIPVVSNASANRKIDDVPMLVPEINPDHLDIIKIQQKNHGWDQGEKHGFIVVKPNCSIQSYLTPIYALEQAGYPVVKIFVTTLQAVSGAGYPGVPSLDMIDNIVPYIGGEEEKTETEPLKILGKIINGKFVNKKDLKISATCTRVPVSDGHTAIVNIKFKNKIPNQEQIINIWKNFKSVPQKLDLPFAPIQPIIYKDEENRPQPKKDRDSGKGMAVTIGRLRKCNIFDYKFVALSHNTVRGAAGGGILNAELLVKKGHII